MDLETADISELEKSVLSDLNSKVYLHTRFSFLMAHKGFRRGKMHVFMGAPSGGKSTLIRSLVVDAASNEKSTCRVLVYLSEESEIDYKAELVKLRLPPGTLLNVDLVSELTGFSKSPDIIGELYHLIKENNYDIVFFDNLTTSSCYSELTPKDQKNACSRLKRLAIETNVALVLVVHTGSTASQGSTRLLTYNDVRGTKNIANFAEFWYTMQNFTEGNSIHPTIHVEKHRGFSPKDRFFYLNYNSRYMCYTSDEKLNFDEFKEYFNKRNKL